MPQTSLLHAVAPAAPTSPLRYLDIDTRDPAEYLAALDALRWRKLQKQIRYVWTNEDYYRQRFLEAGVTSPDDVRSLDDFRRLPAFIDKARHRESQDESLKRYGHPLGLHLTTAPENAVHLAATSGTTGTPTFYVFSRKDLAITYEVLGRMFAVMGIRPGDTTFHAFGLSLWLAGITYAQALEAYGARPVCVGAEGGVPKILRYIELTKPRFLFATPSMVNQLIERAGDEIGKPVGALGIHAIFCCGEPGASQPAFRARVREAAENVVRVKLDFLRGSSAVPLVPDLDALPGRVPDPEGKAFFLGLAARSVTVLRGADFLPMKPENSGSVLLAGQDLEFMQEGRLAFPAAKAVWYARDYWQLTLDMAAAADTIIFHLANDGGGKFQEGLSFLRAIRGLGKRVVILSVFNPTDLEQVAWADCILAIYGASSESFKAGFSALTGLIEARGALPFARK